MCRYGFLTYGLLKPSVSFRDFNFLNYTFGILFTFVRIRLFDAYGDASSGECLLGRGRYGVICS